MTRPTHRKWTEVFGSERLTGALLNRLTHHVHILAMNGESYRLKQSRQTANMLSSDLSPGIASTDIYAEHSDPNGTLSRHHGCPKWRRPSQLKRFVQSSIWRCGL